jgi:hypothetical protein
VCEHMDPAFAANTLNATAASLGRKVSRLPPWPSERSGDTDIDWPLVLFVGRKLGAALPRVLAEAIATRKERAAALAGVFWKAGKQLCAEKIRLLHGEGETRLLDEEAAVGEENSKITHEDAERMGMWDAMGRVPKELQQRIAVEAHLIIL